MKISEVISESVDDSYISDHPRDIERTAERMIRMHGRGRYTPHERASDHAFSHDRGSKKQAYWLAVAKKIRELENKLDEKTSSKYLSPTKKLKKIRVLDAPYGTARQPELEKKFFGAG